MAKLNKKASIPVVTTHGGAKVKLNLTPIQNLERSVLSCMLWEDEFYEDGKSISNRIAELVPKCTPQEVYQLAINARNKYYLRHIPLFLATCLLKHKDHKHVVRNLLPQIIQRPDELCEFLAIYWKNGRSPVAAQAKKGLAEAFCKFDGYQLAKYNRPTKIKLRDVMLLCHPRPKDKDQEILWKQLLENKLPTPDTRETGLAAKDPNVWKRLLENRKLGGMAFLRSLHIMKETLDPKYIIKKLHEYAKLNLFKKVLPFRFITACMKNTDFAVALDTCFEKTMANKNPLNGYTVVVIDFSDSMMQRISKKSMMRRFDAACALAAIIASLNGYCRVFATAGNDTKRVHATKEVGAFSGLELVYLLQLINKKKKLGRGGIFLYQTMEYISKQVESHHIDRVIVITDEQDCDIHSERSPDRAKLLGKKNYIINIGSYDKAIAYRKFTHINGFSENVIEYILAAEQTEQIEQQ